jgi:hypothetical protein
VPPQKREEENKKMKKKKKEKKRWTWKGLQTATALVNIPKQRLLIEAGREVGCGSRRFPLPEINAK